MRQSKLLNNQFTKSTPVWFNFQIQTKEIADETQFLQLGNSEDREFNSYIPEITPLYSAWTSFPSPTNPNGLYKYASFEVNLNKDLHQTNRQTYSILDLLGDCGGLMDILFAMGDFLINPFSIYAARSTIATLLVSLIPTEEKVKAIKDTPIRRS